MPPPVDAAGQWYFTVELPDKTELESVVERVRQVDLPIEQTDNSFLIHDPSQDAVILVDGLK
jgi:hypothetical protein